MSAVEDRIANLSPEKRQLLLKRLAQAERRPATPSVPRLPREPGRRYPLSLAQQRLWLLDRLEPGTTAYNLACSMWAEGRVDTGWLRRALRRMVARHESLRTTFGADGAEPFQVIGEPRSLPVPLVDLSALPDGAGERQALGIARRAAAQSFDLARGPLLRIRLLRLSPWRHLLAIDAHHIVLDGWSIELFFRDLAALYDELAGGEPAALPELPLGYADFAAFQRSELESPQAGAQLEGWRKLLAGPLPVLELPGDRPRPPRPSFRGDAVPVTFPRETSAALQRFAGGLSASPFMVLLAAFGTLLGRYTGQRDLLVGTPVSNRRPELAGVIGYFVNTLVVRLDLGGELTFRRLVERVREAVLASTAHQDLPVERLIEELQPNRDLSRSPLFQTLLSYQNFGLDTVSPPAFRLRPVPPDAVNPQSAKFDLSFFLTEESRGLTGFLEYSVDLFDAATIERWGGHFRTVLAAALAAPDRKLGELALLTEPERRMLAAANETAAEIPEPATLHGAFESRAAAGPNAPALVAASRRLSYGELAGRAAAQAARLRDAGVGRGDLVGVYLERSPEMVVALLGILEAGAAYLPLDPAFPAGRIHYMLEDAGVAAVVTQDSLASDLPPGTEVLLVAPDHAPEPAAAAPPPAVDPLDRAYVIYTSGSTGRPKGVEIPHRAAANFLTAMRREPGLGRSDRLCAVTTLSFDIAVLELFLPLAVGATIVLADRATAADGAALAGLLEGERATVLQATPATWRLLLATGWPGRPGLKALCGGEPLAPDLAAELQARCGELWNVYGPTETTVWSTAGRVEGSGGRISIGLPIANTEIHIVDRGGRWQPVGVPGELMIGGAGLARGYLRRPSLTAGRFLPDPFTRQPGGRLYRSGDLARRLADGRVEVLGRVDHQVKVRGHRIELGEIEVALMREPEVREAVVTCREDRPGDVRLVAYVVAEAGRSPRAGDLREPLRHSLPEYMLPAAFVVLGELPRTPNGKVDRGALPAPEPEEPAERVLPESPAEVELARLWREVLALPAVGVTESFFDLGGHSLLGAQLLALVEREMGVALPLRALFDAPTIRQLCGVIFTQQVETLGGDDVAGLLGDLESLDDEQLRQMLAAEEGR